MSCCDTSGNCSEKQQQDNKQFDIPEKFKDAIDILGDKQVLKLITKKGSDSAERATAGCTAQARWYMPIMHFMPIMQNEFWVKFRQKEVVFNGFSKVYNFKYQKFRLRRPVTSI